MTDTDLRRMNRVFWPTREGEGGCAGAEQEAARRPRELTERDVGGAGERAERTLGVFHGSQAEDCELGAFRP